MSACSLKAIPLSFTKPAVAHSLSALPAKANVAILGSQSFTFPGGVPPYTCQLTINASSATVSMSANVCNYTAGASFGKDQIQISDSIGEVATAEVGVLPSHWNLATRGAFQAGATTFATAFDASGTPYLAIADTTQAGLLSVLSYSQGSWDYVGPAGFSATTITSLTIAIGSDGKPIVNYLDTGFTDWVQHWTLLTLIKKFSIMQMKSAQHLKGPR